MARTKKPRTFGKYRLLEKLRTEGSCISVYRAHQTLFNREIELRALTVPGGPESPLGRRFMEELKILASLSHPSVLEVLDVGTVARHLFFSTPLRRCQPLHEYLKEQGGTLEPAEFLTFAEVVTDAVACMHRSGVIHRGISTRSVFVDLERRLPYVAECSAVRDIRRESLTALGVPPLNEICPTPETTAGAVADARTDVFLLSALFFETLTGDAPYPRDDRRLFDLLSSHGGGFPALGDDLATTFGGSALPGVEDVLARGLSPEPADRFPSAVELLDELAAVRRRFDIAAMVHVVPDGTAKPDRPSKTTEPPPPPSPPRGLEPRHVLGALIGAVVVAVVVAVVLGALPGGGLDRRPPPAVPAVTVPDGEPSGVDDLAILRMSHEIDGQPSTADTVAPRLAAFRVWLVANRSAKDLPCRYVDFMSLRHRCLEKPTAAVLAEFDDVVKQAAIAVRNRPQ